MYSPRQYVPYNRLAADRQYNSPNAIVKRMRRRLMVPGFASVALGWLKL